MDTKLLIAILLTILPLIELRGGMPIAVKYALDSGNSLLIVFFAIVLLNILVVIPIFFFLDFLHVHFLKWKWYEKSFNFFLRRVRKKADKIEKKKGLAVFSTLAIFVAIPLPGTGAWTGSLIVWLLGLERRRSFLAISAGVLIAGIIVFLASVGVISLFGIK